MWTKILGWIHAHNLGDAASVLGLLVSLVGFGLTLYGVYKSKTAAEEAEQAAKDTRERIQIFNVFSNISEAITVLEEIKRLHRQGDSWAILPDRYASIRKVLVSIRHAEVLLTDQQLKIVQGAVSNLRAIENKVERGLGDPKSLQPMRFNKVISGDIDNLITVLVELRNQKTGADNVVRET